MIRKILIASLLLSGMALAQPPQGGPGRGPGGPGGPGGPDHTELHRLLPPGPWWKNAEVVKTIGLSDDQVRKIEAAFTDSRVKLVEIHASLQKEEIKLEPLLESETPDEGAVLAGIDRIAALRANLEKANAQMAFAIRRVLTPEQWKKLRSTAPRPGQFPGPAPGPHGDKNRGGHEGPGGPQAENMPPPPPGADGFNN